MTYFYTHTFELCIGGKAYIEGAFTLRTAWHKKEEAYHIHSLAVGGCSAGGILLLRISGRNSISQMTVGNWKRF
ncbi:hypothetical protein [Paenibacillus sp. Y412MC10]|uniref:hypothetical protein n=1 Tax=Geobacillus sp. (strain Y412MC10) TaxID=481743 RepID=UPI0011AB598A|nr:hypothetical protein [Paenibacillus sp. Y412MC10]